MHRVISRNNYPDVDVTLCAGTPIRNRNKVALNKTTPMRTSVRRRQETSAKSFVYMRAFKLPEENNVA